MSALYAILGLAIFAALIWWACSAAKQVDDKWGPK